MPEILSASARTRARGVSRGLTRTERARVRSGFCVTALDFRYGVREMWRFYHVMGDRGAWIRENIQHSDVANI